MLGNGKMLSKAAKTAIRLMDTLGDATGRLTKGREWCSDPR